MSDQPGYQRGDRIAQLHVKSCQRSHHRSTNVDNLRGNLGIVGVVVGVVVVNPVGNAATDGKEGNESKYSQDE